MNEEKRKRKQYEKDKKIKKVLWSIIIVLVVVLAALKVSEININSIKSKVTDSNGKISVSDALKSNGFPLSLDTSDNVQIRPFNDKIAVMTSTSVSVVNPTTAEVNYTFDHGYSSPIMKVCGAYTVLYDQGSTKLRLDSSTDKIYETSPKKNILCANVASNGNVVYATTSGTTKCSVFVFSKSLQKKFSYDVSTGYVTSVAIDKNGKKVAFAVVESKNAKLLTTIYTMGINDKEPTKSASYSNTSVIDIEYSNGGKLFVVGSDFVSVLKSAKKEEKLVKQGSMLLVSYEFDSSRALTLAYQKYENAAECNVVRYSTSGNEKSLFTVKGVVKDISYSDNTFCVLFNDNVIKTFNSKGEVQKTISDYDSVNSVTEISGKIFVQKHSVIESCN